MTTVTDPIADDLLHLARKSSSSALEEKFLEAFAEDPDRFDVYLRVAREMRNAGKRAQAATLLSLMVEHYERSGTPAQRVELLSFIAGAQEKERSWRGQLAKALQDLHAERPGFEIFLEACGLTGDASVDAAIESLEKMLRFDIGSYALHASGWGVGHVNGVDVVARELTIVFEGGRRHSMPVQSAVETLTPLPADDWRVLRHFKVEEMRELCERDPGEVIARMLRQVGRPVDVATLRGHLLNAVIPASDWSRWWSSARKAALQRPDVEMQGNKLIWRKVSVGDRIAAMRRVLSARQVLDLAEALLASVGERGAADTATMEQLLPALCEGASKHALPDDPSPLVLLLLADEIAEQHALTRLALDQALAAQFRDQDATFRRLSQLSNPRFERRALDRLRDFAGARYLETLSALARVASSRLLDQIVPELVEAGRVGELRGLLQEAMRRPDAAPELLVFARRRARDARFTALLDGFEPAALVERCLAMGEQGGRGIDARLRGLQRQAAKELCDGGAREFRALLRTISTDAARLLKQRIELLRGLTDHSKTILLSALVDVHPELRTVEETIEAHLDENVVWSTSEGITRRNQEYEHLIHVEMPRIFDAVGRAAAHGDLSENAEYTAAVEERARMSKRAEQMADELRRARVIDASLLVEGRVTIGTRVRVRDLGSGVERGFTFLGPWDVDLERGQLDYRAQLPQAFMGAEVGQRVRAELGGKPAEFEVLSIAPAIDAAPKG